MNEPVNNYLIYWLEDDIDKHLEVLENTLKPILVSYPTKECSPTPDGSIAINRLVGIKTRLSEIIERINL